MTGRGLPERTSPANDKEQGIELVSPCAVRALIVGAVGAALFARDRAKVKR
jgi:hypothetical protein